MTISGAALLGGAGCQLSGCAGVSDAQRSMSAKLVTVIAPDVGLPFGTGMVVLPSQGVWEGRLVVGAGDDSGAPGSIYGFALTNWSRVFGLCSPSSGRINMFPRLPTAVSDMTGDGVMDFGCAAPSSDWLNGAPPSQLLLMDGREGRYVAALQGSTTANDGFGSAFAEVNAGRLGRLLAVLLPWKFDERHEPYVEVELFELERLQRLQAHRIQVDGRTAVPGLVELRSAMPSNASWLAGMVDGQLWTLDLAGNSSHVIPLDFDPKRNVAVDAFVAVSDVDKDGYEDLVVTCNSKSDLGGASNASVHALGSGTGRVIWSSSLGNAHVMTGTGLVRVPDIDLDGTDDAMISMYRGGETSAGSVCFVSARSGHVMGEVAFSACSSEFGQSLTVIGTRLESEAPCVRFAVSDSGSRGSELAPGVRERDGAVYVIEVQFQAGSMARSGAGWPIAEIVLTP